MEIDFVITWVDGSDPKWQAEKARYAPRRTDDSNSVNRYRDWGLLPFWFRAVETFAPWVRRIHFITWGHLPEFLATDHEKLHIVRHEDYIPDRYLPTFSANPIEMNMHRIRGLSEQFVYFNDDMFLLRPMKPEQFFRNGLPCIFGAERPLIPTSREVWQHLTLNDIAVINRHFSKRDLDRRTARNLRSREYPLKDRIRSKAAGLLYPDGFAGFKNVHGPAPFLKSTFEAIWAEEETLLSETSGHKFRSPEDVNQWLALWWQVAGGQFVPYRTDNLAMSAFEVNVGRICDVIETQSHDMLCINDPAADLDFEPLAKRLITAFSSILPNKSSFER